MKPSVTFPICGATCPLRATCIHALCYEQRKTEENIPERALLMCVHPAVRGYATDACSAFRLAEKQRYARGMKHLFDDVPTRTAQKLRERLIKEVFCSKSSYYHYRRGNCTLGIEQIEAIEHIFAEEGLPTPTFDEEIEEYPWISMGK